MPGYHEFHYTLKKYDKELVTIQQKRKELSEEYRISWSKEKILDKAAAQFQEGLDMQLFSFWLGTNYDFYGKSESPGKGEIACGYFVTTLLEDMGIDLKREALAQMASEKMIQQLVSPSSIKRFSNQSLNTVLEYIRHQGKGVYVIGLDTHTGFLIHDGNAFYFIHASGRSPWQVVEERAEQSTVLLESKYRVICNLTADKDFIKKWINVKVLLQN